MKMKKITFFISLYLVALLPLQAQAFLEDFFDYEANRVLIMDPVSASDNYDGITGWSTVSNSLSGNNAFNITDAPLMYNGYIFSGIGNALKHSGAAGQSVFKLFPQNYKNDTTVYISFLIHFPNVEVSGGDYFFGLKLEPNANSTNFGGRIYAQVDPAFPNEEVILGINKLSGGTTTFVNGVTGPFYPANTTHLMVMKYKVGVINGETLQSEVGNFDDEMWLFMNPPLDGVEPDNPILYHADPNQNDIFRNLSSNDGRTFGGARGVYLRSSAEGSKPAYVIDAIRAGLSWADVIQAPTGLKHATANNFKYSINQKTIVVEASDFNYNTYELVSLAGQRLMAGSLNGETTINASDLHSGVYILNLSGSQRASVKVMI